MDYMHLLSDFLTENKNRVSKNDIIRIKKFADDISKVKLKSSEQKNIETKSFINNFNFESELIEKKDNALDKKERNERSKNEQHNIDYSTYIKYFKYQYTFKIIISLIISLIIFTLLIFSTTKKQYYCIWPTNGKIAKVPYEFYYKMNNNYQFQIKEVPDYQLISKISALVFLVLILFITFYDFFKLKKMNRKYQKLE